MNLSIVICTHNPRPDYLRRTLDALQAQTLPTDQWEVLLIDNASKEPLAKSWDLSWHPHGRHILEEELGLTPARLRGIEEASGEVLVFVDDDNVLFPNFLSECLRIGGEWPLLGAWGGQLTPEFEGGAPTEDWKIKMWTTEPSRDTWSNNYDRNATPAGAGVCVRRQVAAEYARLVREDPLRRTLDRKGAELNSAGDIDMAYVACDLGLGTGVFVSLKLYHLIPKSRMSDDYLLRLKEGFGYSNTVLAAFRGTVPPHRPVTDRVIDFCRRLRVSPTQRMLNAAYDAGRLRATRQLNAK